MRLINLIRMTPERYRKLRRTLERRQPDLTVIAENVHKPHNVAALIRTCDAVGIGTLHAVSDDGEFRRHHMVSGGSNRWVEIALHESLAPMIEDLKIHSFQIVAAHFSDFSRDYRHVDYTKPTAFLMGSELTGVSETAAELADTHVEIPMRGNVSSLNVSVATALLLYEAARQREAAGLYDECHIPDEELELKLFEWCHPDIAARCRQRGLPYPPLDEDGDLAANPFTDTTSQSG